MNAKNFVRASALATLLLAGAVFAQTTSPLTSLITVTPQVVRGTDDALIATVLLNAENADSDVRVDSLAFAVSANAAGTGILSNCSVRDLADYADRLNTGSNEIGLVAGSNTVALDEDLVIPEGDSVTLVLTCDVSAAASPGTVIAVGVDPAFIESVDEDGAEITATGALGTDGTTRPVSGALTVTAVEAAPPSTTPGVPGIPNTGAGGSGLTLVVLALAGAMMVLGAGFALLRRNP